MTAAQIIRFGGPRRDAGFGEMIEPADLQGQVSLREGA
jgi:hypothetical protein